MFFYDENLTDEEKKNYVNMAMVYAMYASANGIRF